MKKMKTATALILFALCVVQVLAEQAERGPLKRTKFLPLENKPDTTIRVTPAGAEAFWQRKIPPDLRDKPNELDEFKRTHAHLFWKPYVDKIITVSGQHYCPCCFYAAIGYSGRGYSDGWTIRLDEYIAIGFPEGSTAYSKGGENMGTKGPLRPLLPIVEAVGTVNGPHSITEALEAIMPGGQALAYYVLKQNKE